MLVVKMEIYLKEFDPNDDNPMGFIRDLRRLVDHRPKLIDWNLVYDLLEEALN